MPVFIPKDMEEEWIEQVKDLEKLNRLVPILTGWSSENWIVEELNKNKLTQMNLF